ncbi:conjugal transfer protein TraJ [Burkholderia contaminans FFH2055]|uniref:virB8 family protein n=1 Tax=Burkholderia contaminans TaxID=488447 RepID=UPI00062577A6|nr:type IV secretion system protein [Burkholderia contaminans]KKL31658.1 conjugal transfer protein TraJ [Burkholderia contaminans FFH2055]MEB4634283.1 type IV secretion system protein [Burkholderia contaminans]MEB4642070.1 type IV secretion system protein [Burkholderia contaminans]MEB4657065.1 type IV secretion system protein [Burkholderia contaminans]MEB4665102.1 type IV secretion system protein [Burkholderia contaminans]
MNDQSDYRRALDFEASLTALQACSERRAWKVAFAAVIVAIGSVAALAVMMPFYRVVPLPIEVNKLTGEAQLIEVLDAKHVPLREIEDKHWVEVYVRTRERYDWGLLQMDYDRVLEMSDDSVARAYRQIYSGPNALDQQLGASIQYRTRIVSTTLVPDEPGHAVVHLERTVRKNGIDTGEPAKRFVITLAFTYRPTVLVRERSAIENPFGFKVTAYSRDAEDTPPALHPSAGAGQ